MDLREFATTILYEAQLSQKLICPGILTDAQPGEAIAIPSAPARLPAMALNSKEGHKKKRPGFPSPGSLEKEENRGLVLHFFANHELLALELMALALLRFPDAPAGFRMGLAHTMIEEQKHLNLYLGRMQQLGVEFGTVPVNRYFWDCLAQMRSPLDYTVGMSLTFEQANLDYSLHFHELFARIGDAQTAEILATVYREEVGHVRHGVNWFNRLRPEGEADWDAYKRLLSKPLTPARAKGLGFDIEARLQAGLSQHFIDELAVFGHSKGRPPVLYWFNPGCEEELVDPRVHASLPKAIRLIQEDLGSVMMFVASRDDTVLCKPKPSSAHLAHIQDAGFALPQFVSSAGELQDRQLSRFAPWGGSPAARHFFEEHSLSTREAPNFPPDLGVFTKSWSTELALRHGWFAGQVCHDRTTVEHAIREIFARHESIAVIKAACGSSGRNMIRIRSNATTLLSDNERRWLDRTLAQQGKVIVEPWLERAVDLSVQLQVGAERPVVGITRLFCDMRGQYAGHALGRKFDDLPSELRRWLYEHAVFSSLGEAGTVVARELLEAGFTGPAGIDAFVYISPEGFALRPVVEINARYTMGRIALALDKHIQPSRHALWLHMNTKQVERAGFAGFAAFAAQARSRYPLHKHNGLIHDGFLATNDPEQAQVVLSCLLVGDACALAKQFSRGDNQSL